MFALRLQVLILRNTQRTAVGGLHQGAYCFHLARGEYETGQEVRRQRIAESPCVKRCYRRRPCHRLSGKADDDIAMAEWRLQVLTHSRSFLLMYVSNPNHPHPPSKLSHSAVAARPEVLPW